MDHTNAVRDNLAERYLLNELSDEIREDFEEHYFGCVHCAEDVRLGATFIANAQTVLREEPRSATIRVAGKHSGWFGWLWNPAPAYALAAVLALVAIVQRTPVSPELRPQVISAVDLRPATRGAAQVVRVAADQQTIQVNAGVPAGVAYACTITDATGQVLASIDTPVLPTPQLSLLLPAKQFREGRFKLSVRDRTQVAGTYSEEFDFITQP